MDRTRRAAKAGNDVAIARGANGSRACRARDGGWAASTSTISNITNNIPFSDHGAMLDRRPKTSPPCCSMLAQLGATGQNSEPLAGRVAYLRRKSLRSWYVTAGG